CRPLCPPPSCTVFPYTTLFRSRRDGISTLEEMSRRGIEVPALVLTTFDDAELVLGAMRAGARGYLLKDVTLDELVQGIHALVAGDRKSTRLNSSHVSISYAVFC